VNETEAADVHHHRGDAWNIQRKADQAFRGCAPAALSTGAEHDGEPARLLGTLRALDSRPVQRVRRPRLGSAKRPQTRHAGNNFAPLGKQGASIVHHSCGTNLQKHTGDRPLKVGTPIPQRRPRTFATLTSHIERDRC